MCSFLTGVCPVPDAEQVCSCDAGTAPYGFVLARGETEGSIRLDLAHARLVRSGSVKVPEGDRIGLTVCPIDSLQLPCWVHEVSVCIVGWSRESLRGRVGLMKAASDSCALVSQDRTRVFSRRGSAIRHTPTGRRGYKESRGVVRLMPQSERAG